MTLPDHPDLAQVVNRARQLSNQSGTPNQDLSLEFEHLAEWIIQEFQPTTVLEVGCCQGFLVHALRKQGVQAWGIDVTATGIEQADPSIRPYLWIGDISSTFPQRYDLIICLDILDHLPVDQLEAVIRNFCWHSDDILFSTKLNDSQAENTLVDRPPEYWPDLFVRQGFIHDLDFDASFIAPLAFRFHKLALSTGQIVQAYERKLWHLHQENQARRAEGLQHRKLLAEREAEIGRLSLDLANKERLLLELEHALQALRGSRSWKLIQGTRQFLIPQNSRREALLYSWMDSARILKSQGWQAFQRHVSDRTRRRLRAWRLRLRYAWGKSEQVMVVEPVPLPNNHPAKETKMPQIQASVDLGVIVNDPLPQVRACLELLIRYTPPLYNLILVDDGNEGPTQSYLIEFCVSQGGSVIHNEQSQGFSESANQVLQASQAENVVLLRSNSLVTPGWLDRLLSCADSDARIGMLAPLCNTPGWQSVPDSENLPPSRMSINDLAHLVALYAAPVYPRLPLLTDDCLMLKRRLIQTVGFFEDSTFTDGMTAVGDYCLRARQANFELAIAEDSYIYRIVSDRQEPNLDLPLSERSIKSLEQKYAPVVIQNALRTCRTERLIQGCRARNQVAFERETLIERGKQRFEGRRVLFLLPVAEPGGGANVILQESAAMQRFGVDVHLLTLHYHKKAVQNYQADDRLPTHYIDQLSKSARYLPKFDAVIATVFHTVGWMELPVTLASLPRRGYYIQDYEPDFFPANTPEYQTALASYTRFPDLVRLTKTSWNRNILLERAGVECNVIGPSVDIDLFRPRHRESGGPEHPVRVAAMIRPSTPRRQPDLTMCILKELVQRHPGKVEILLFGCPITDPDFQALTIDFPWRNAGVLSRRQLARLLNLADIFVDFSAFQAMGLTAMEAMACGAAVIVPEKGGSGSFAKHEINALVVDTSTEAACLAALERLVNQPSLREDLQQKAIFDICQYFPERAAFNLLAAMFP